MERNWNEWLFNKGGEERRKKKLIAKLRGRKFYSILKIYEFLLKTYLNTFFNVHNFSMLNILQKFFLKYIQFPWYRLLHLNLCYYFFPCSMFCHHQKGGDCWPQMWFWWLQNIGAWISFLLISIIKNDFREFFNIF